MIVRKLDAAWIILALLAPAIASAEFRNERIDVTLTAASKQYCHIVQFPQGWKPRKFTEDGEILFFDPGSDYEFRTAGDLSTQVLVAGFTEFVGTNYYTNNRYKVDLSDPNVRVVAVGPQTWKSAAVLPFGRKNIFRTGRPPGSSEDAEFHGFQFRKTGEFWALDGSRLSPDGAWLVLQSSGRASETAPCGWTAQVFFDFFNADTGAKIFSLEGTFTSNVDNDPETVLATTGWVTERYFIIPLGRHKERCVVCEFSAKTIRLVNVR